MTRTRWNTKLVSEEMKKENCELIDEYKRGDLRIKYLYENNEYSVRWNDWIRSVRPSRPHLSGGNRNTKPHKKWNNETVNELLKKDNCELVDEYRSTKQRFKYKYQNSFYWVTLDDWIHHKARPHLYINENEQQFREYLEENDISFVTQKSFNDLKSSRNYKLRFDFYIPDFELLVEIDDRSHSENNDQRINATLKNQYCVEHKLKLLRIDYHVTKNEFEDALCQVLEADADIYVFQYGQMYKINLLQIIKSIIHVFLLATLCN